jgi:hypothetical protein
MRVRRGRSPFDCFMRALHRRFVLVRGAERIGAGVLIASGGAAALLPLAWWRGVASLPIVLFVLGAGAAVGLIAGIVQRPTRMDAAAEADRQFRLADLLGTAVMVSDRRCTPQPWDSAVIASADERCRRLSPSSVILYRWGARAWGGVLLGTCLVLILSLTMTQSAPTQAGVTVADPFGGGERVDGARRPPGEGPVGMPYSNGAGRIPTPRGNEPSGDDAAPATQNPTSPGALTSSAAPAAQGNSADPSGSGAGSRSTPGPAARSSLPRDDTAATPSHGTGNPAGQPKVGAGGAGDGQDVGTAGGHPGGGATSHHAGTTPPPPWRTSSWPVQQQQQFDQTLRSRGSEYDAYQDLIRAYFERE